MHCFIADVNPKVGLISIFVTVGGRFILASWIPSKYPDRARVEKIIRGAALEKDRFLALAEAIPIVLREQFEGKTLKQWVEMVGTAYHIEAELEAL